MYNKILITYCEHNFQTCYCEDHVKRKGFKYDRNQAIPCPKCNYDTQQTKDLSMSSKYLCDVCLFF